MLAAMPSIDPATSLYGSGSNSRSRQDACKETVTADGNGLVADPGAAYNGNIPRLSVREALHGRAVLITGGTGYVGSVLLEQLLRVAGAQLGNVYILARSRNGQTSQQRVGRMLGSGLFDVVRQQYPDTLRKLVILEGDLSSPGLGLSESALAELAAEPSIVVIHGAARIALHDPIQDALRNNYEGTRRLLELVEKRLPRCAGFVHLSTTYVGIMLPQNDCMQEEMMPLMFGDQPIDHARLARELLVASRDQADKRAALLCKNWNLINTYLLSKHLCEALVNQYHAEGRIAGGGVAIVRPSLVSAIAGEPYPGYVGNMAGPSGYITAFALGFFGKNVCAWHPWNLLDMVPCDIVAAVTLGAAATLAAGIRSREQFYEVCAGAATLQQVHTMPAAVNGGDGMQVLDCKGNQLHIGSTANGQQWRDGTRGNIMVFHAATSTVNPCLHYEAYEMAYNFFKAHMPKHRVGSYVMVPVDYSPVPRKVAFAKRITAFKVWMAVQLLSCSGQKKLAHRLRVGFAAWTYANTVKHDKTVFVSIRHALALERLIPLDEQRLMPLVWRGDWKVYANTYMAAVTRLYMCPTVPPSTPTLPHTFVFKPNTPIPESELPPLAGTRDVMATMQPVVGM